MNSTIAVSPKSISFGEKLAASSTFDALFRDGMALVEETAAYLDGAGRDEARHLGRVAALAYASESMRLTTRLMQIASWLLLQRAVNEGEMTQSEASPDKRRTRAAWQTMPAPAAQGASALPSMLLALIGQSLDLQTRIQRLDTLIEPRHVEAPRANPLDAHFALLRQAFPN